MPLGSILRGLGSAARRAGAAAVQLGRAAGRYIPAGAVFTAAGAIGSQILEELTKPRPAPATPPQFPVVPDVPTGNTGIAGGIRIPGTGPGGIIQGFPDPGDLIRMIQGGLSGAGFPVTPPVPAQPSPPSPAPVAGTDIATVAQSVLLSRMMTKQKGDGRSVLEALVSGSLQKGLIQAPAGFNTPRGLRYYSPPGFRTVKIMGKPYAVFKPLAKSLGLVKAPARCYISAADVKKARAARSLAKKVRGLARLSGIKLTRTIKTKRK